MNFSNVHSSLLGKQHIQITVWCLLHLFRIFLVDLGEILYKKNAFRQNSDVSVSI